MFNPERLELARKRRRLTAKSLAEKAGIAPVTLSRIVNRQQVPDDTTVAALVGALGYPPAFFFQAIGKTDCVFGCRNLLFYINNRGYIRWR